MTDFDEPKFLIAAQQYTIFFNPTSKISLSGYEEGPPQLLFEAQGG